MPYEPGLYDLYKKYQWVTFGENCPICNAMRGRVYTGDVFASSQIWPGFHPNCDCTLKRVPDDTPESSYDIFPDYFVQFLHHGLVSDVEDYDFWKGISLFPKGGWQPYNIFITNEFMRATPQGGTLADAIYNFLTGNVSDDSIYLYPKWRGLFESLGWKSWINLLRDPSSRLKYTIDHYQGVGDSYFSAFNLAPKPEALIPVNPSQSFYYPRGAGATWAR